MNTYVQQVTYYRTHINMRFAVKIRTLSNYQLRLVRGITPLPSGIDIANTIKYFSQTLLTVLKNVPNFPLDLLKNPEKDSERVSLFPSLNYRGLYNTLVPLIEVAPLIQIGLEAFGHSILQCLGCLLPFLEYDHIDNLPYVAASSLAVLPKTLHQDIVNYLCYYLLPFTMTRLSGSDDAQKASNLVVSIIMMVFQYSNNPVLHYQLIQCLMTLKQNVVKDLLGVIAYGTPIARSSSVKLLFYYWPTLSPNLFDRKNLRCKFAEVAKPLLCQRVSCCNEGKALAVKVCYDHCLSITFASKLPPPLYLCTECIDDIHREHPNQIFFDILHPMQQVPMFCENKNCKATEKCAVSICFSAECTNYNGNHPIRYCEQCNHIKHNNRPIGDHIVQKSLPSTWTMDAELQTYMIEAIVSLLKESKVPNSGVHYSPQNRGRRMKPPVLTKEERQLIGRYGVWMLVGQCTPHDDTPHEVLGRLVATLLHWFHVTSSEDQDDDALDNLKTVFVCSWLQGIRTTHYNLFLSCLMPHPPEFARVNGNWNFTGTTTSRLNDGLNRLYCLVPYGIITPEIWDHVMPHWLDVIVNDVPQEELLEFKMILSNIFDSDRALRKMYNFIATRFESPSSNIQQQAIRWLQVLTALGIKIPLALMFAIFENGVCVVKENPSDSTIIIETDDDTNAEEFDEIETVAEDEREGEFENAMDFTDLTRLDFRTNEEYNLSVYISMLELLLKQVELHKINKDTGNTANLYKDLTRLLKCMVKAPWINKHTCGPNPDSSYCNFCVMWHQLSLQLITTLSPVDVMNSPLENVVAYTEMPSSSDIMTQTEAVMVQVANAEVYCTEDMLMPQIKTATVETNYDQFEVDEVIPLEDVVPVVARVVTVTEADVGMATVQVSKAQVMNHRQIVVPEPDDLDNFWVTSVEKFHFILDELPHYAEILFRLLVSPQSVSICRCSYQSTQGK